MKTKNKFAVVVKGDIRITLWEDELGKRHFETGKESCKVGDIFEAFDKVWPDSREQLIMAFDEKCPDFTEEIGSYYNLTKE